MNISIHKIATVSNKESAVYLCNKKNATSILAFSAEEKTFIKQEIENRDKKLISINRYTHRVFLQLMEKKKEEHLLLESCRKAGGVLCSLLNELKETSITIVDTTNNAAKVLAMAEGIALNNYQFLRYKMQKTRKPNSVNKINIHSNKINNTAINELQIMVAATFVARDLVNETPAVLTATKFSKEMKSLGKDAGFRVEVLTKSKIESLKMGGVLAVNKGSEEPPTFNILEWKPKNTKNKKPYVLVGKGVVYDTGGYNIKVGTGMETMKCDMAGGAAVAGALYAIAKAKLNVHVIGLIPVTDNRINGKAYVAGDVITISNGKTVEVLNTDAEGRLILADALVYAQKYKPELVIDLATLTGAAVAAVGPYGIVAMGTADEKTKNKLKESGNNVYERVAEMPFWEEYGELVKSDIAEIKNIGGPYAGAITAGKFLQHFVDYPWMHFDIAGPAFLSTKDSYRGKGGTGYGVRLLFDFFKKISN